jgi:hypothetical protein
VGVEVETSAEPLREADGGAATVRDTKCGCALALSAEDLAHEDAPDRGERTMVPGEKKPELERNAQNPLAHGHFGKHSVGQVRGRSVHPSGVAGRADTAALARKRDEELTRAFSTPRAQKAVQSTVSAGRRWA